MKLYGKQTEDDRIIEELSGMGITVDPQLVIEPYLGFKCDFNLLKALVKRIIELEEKLDKHEEYYKHKAWYSEY